MIRASKELQASLTDFLALYEEKKVTWGVDDCTMFARHWVETVKGIEVPFEPVNGKKQAIDFIRSQGGLVNIWDNALSQVGIFKGYGDPEFGDVGIIETRAYGNIGGVFAHAGVAAVREAAGGWRWFSPRSVKAFWSLEC